MGRFVIALVSFLHNVLDHKVVESNTEVQERLYRPKQFKSTMIIGIHTIALRGKCVKLFHLTDKEINAQIN